MFTLPGTRGHVLQGTTALCGEMRFDMADIIDNGMLSKDPIRAEFELYSH